MNSFILSISVRSFVSLAIGEFVGCTSRTLVDFVDIVGLAVVLVVVVVETLILPVVESVLVSKLIFGDDFWVLLVDVPASVATANVVVDEDSLVEYGLLLVVDAITVVG